MTLTDALAAVLCVQLHGKTPDALGGEGGYCDVGRQEAAAILADPAFREALTTALAEAMYAVDGHGLMPECREEAAAIVKAMLP